MPKSLGAASLAAFLWLLVPQLPTVARCAEQPAAADVVLTGGNVLTLDAAARVVQALAIRDGKLIAVGSDESVRRHVRATTKVIDLAGRTVIPGLIETHTHPIGVARSESVRPWVELSSIAQVQNWIRRTARELPAGRWIRVPRIDITRLRERRHPTPAELDAACVTHPVHLNAARKDVLNSLGFERMGVTRTDHSIPGATVLRDADGTPLMLSGATGFLRREIGQPTFTDQETLEALEPVLRRYNEVGITSIFDRANNRDGYRLWQALRDGGRLTTRVTVTFRFSARTEETVERFIADLGLKPGDGDEWLKPGPLKITVDGGIHWGNTRLSEPYGNKRIEFYRLEDPRYRGDLFYTPEQMETIFRVAHRHGWQMSAHVTGDDGVERVLDAVEAVQGEASRGDRRFTLIHAYFPNRSIVERVRRLGVCVDTQPYLYYRDSDAIAEVYGAEWADRFIGIGDWVQGGIPTAINSDHMIGLDPDHAMNSFNPFLMMHIVVTRRNLQGRIYGERQKVARLDALRAMTTSAAYLSFDESRVGSLEKGKFADLAVLDRDPLACPEADIRHTRVLLTMVGGKVVYDRDRGAAEID